MSDVINIKIPTEIPKEIKQEPINITIPGKLQIILNELYQYRSGKTLIVDAINTISDIKVSINSTFELLKETILAIPRFDKETITLLNIKLGEIQEYVYSLSITKIHNKLDNITELLTVYNEMENLLRDLQLILNSHGDLLIQHAEAITAISSNITVVKNLLLAELDKKADRSDLGETNTKLSDLISEVNTKATKASLNSLTETVNANIEKIDTKADKSSIDATNNNVVALLNSITNLQQNSATNEKMQEALNAIDSINDKALHNNELITLEYERAKQAESNLSDEIISTNELLNTTKNDLNDSIITISDNLVESNNSIRNELQNTAELLNNIINERVQLVNASLGNTNSTVGSLDTKINNIESSINILNSDGDGSIKKAVADGVAKVVAEAPADFDTLKEIADWIQNDATGAAAMQNAITELRNNKADLSALETTNKKVTTAQSSANAAQNAIDALNNVIENDFDLAIPNAKNNCAWDTYKYGHSSTSLTKYCNKTEYGQVDNKTILDLDDDVAHLERGGDWRMPTYNEFSELVSKCSWAWTTLNGRYGYRVTSSVNGNSIFIPCAGFKRGTTITQSADRGEYWTSSIDSTIPYRARHLFFSSATKTIIVAERFIGESVRPVCTDASNTNGYDYIDLGLPSGLLWATCNVGASSPEECGSYFAWGETNVSALARVIKEVKTDSNTASAKADANATAIANEATRAKAAEKANADAIATKAEKLALENTNLAISGFETRVTTAESNITSLLELKINASDVVILLNKKLDLSGGTLTGELTGTDITVKHIKTGTDTDNYFQCRKFRGQGTADTYYHALDFGYQGHDLWDFYEYGGVFNFWMNRSETISSPTLLGKITLAGWNGNVIGNVTGNVTGRLSFPSGNGTGIYSGSQKLDTLGESFLFRNTKGIRFSNSDSWDWNVWAGLAYDHASKTVNLGLADGTTFQANNAQTDGKIKTPGISEIYVGTTNKVLHEGNCNNYIKNTDTTLNATSSNPIANSVVTVNFASLRNEIDAIKEFINDTDFIVTEQTTTTSLPEGEGDNLWYGVKKKFEDSNATCTRIGNMNLHRSLPIHNGMRGCLLNDDGTVAKWLNPSTWENEVRDGSQGLVMVQVPDHFRSVYWEEDGALVCKVSEYPLTGYSHIPMHYVGAYLATVDRVNNKLCSIVNTTAQFRGGNNNAAYDGTYRSFLGLPATNITFLNFRNYAANRGTNFYSWYYEAYYAEYWLWVVEHATFDTQKAYTSAKTSEGFVQGGSGPGVTTTDWTSWSSYNGNNPMVPCGVTDKYGNGSGVVQYKVMNADGNVYKTFEVNRWRGIEMPYGHEYQFTDGIFYLILSEASGGKSKIYRAKDPTKLNTVIDDNYEYIGDLPRNENWILKPHGEIVLPKETGGSSARGLCDYSYTNIPTSGEATRVSLVGGSAPDGSCAGLGFLSSRYSLVSATANFGARLSFFSKV